MLNLKNVLLIQKCCLIWKYVDYLKKLVFYSKALFNFKSMSFTFGIDYPAVPVRPETFLESILIGQ